MKQQKTSLSAGVLGLMLTLGGCDLPLEETVYSDLSATGFYQTQGEIEAALVGVYAGFGPGGSSMYAPAGNSTISYLTNLSGDQFFLREEWGGDNPGSNAGALKYFLFSPTRINWLFDIYNLSYHYIAATNLALERIPEANIDGSAKDRYIAEFRALRAFYYSILHSFFGNVPLITEFNASPDFLPEQASAEQIAAFIETELLAATADLPDVNNIGTGNYGRLHKAGAQAILAKLYLNTGQWQKAADMAGAIIDNPHFHLAAEYSHVFDPDNHMPGKANEMLVLIPATTSQPLNQWAVHVLPPDWPGMNAWHGYFMYRDFYDTFHRDDVRNNLIIADAYVNARGQTVTIPPDRVLPHKYPEDPASNHMQMHGNDVPIIRMADIYLTRAEALNRLQGPTQESIDLINAVRSRAFATPNPVSLADFPGQDALNDHILNERGWELWCEAGIRREDLIRHGKWVQQALDRGIAAQSHQVLYAIPQAEMDRNPNLRQNPGY